MQTQLIDMHLFTTYPIYAARLLHRGPGDQKQIEVQPNICMDHIFRF